MASGKYSVKQGGVLYLIVFVIYTDDLLRRIQDTGVSYGSSLQYDMIFNGNYSQ